MQLVKVSGFIAIAISVSVFANTLLLKTSAHEMVFTTIEIMHSAGVIKNRGHLDANLYSTNTSHTAHLNKSSNAIGQYIDYKFNFIGNTQQNSSL